MQQTFTLDPEMSFMLEMCDKLRVAHKIEISSGGSGYEKIFMVSDPSRAPNWIAVLGLRTLVDVISERKLGQQQ